MQKVQKKYIKTIIYKIMVKCQKINLEFTNGISQSFNVNTDVYGNHIQCAAKTAGKLGNNFFSAKYTFNINVNVPHITNIHFINVTHIDKPIIDNYNSSNSSSNFSNVVGETTEHTFYNNIYSILNTATVTISGTILTVTLNNNKIDYLVSHIKIGSNNYNSDSSTSTEKSSSKSVPKILKSSSLSKSSSSSSLSNSSSSLIPIPTKLNNKKHKSVSQDKILKLVAWSAIMSFIMHIFKLQMTRGNKK